MPLNDPVGAPVSCVSAPDSISASWSLYMLECAGGRIYTGITNDVAGRYAAHVSGKGAKFTRAFRPIRLLKVIPHPDRSAASKAEHAVKQLTATQKRAMCATA